jgi:hypothetical protein
MFSRELTYFTADCMLAMAAEGLFPTEEDNSLARLESVATVSL